MSTGDWIDERTSCLRGCSRCKRDIQDIPGALSLVPTAGRVSLAQEGNVSLADPIEAAARRLVDSGALHTAACMFYDGGCTCEPDVAEVLKAFAREVRRQALEEAAQICVDEGERINPPDAPAYAGSLAGVAYGCANQILALLPEEPAK
jgi:hypothetical protein